MAIVVVMLAVLATPESGEAHTNGRLFRYVLSGAHEAPDAPRLVDEPCITEALRNRVRRFGERARRVQSRLLPPPGGPDPDGKDGFLGRLATERALVALIRVSGIEREAGAFAKHAVFYYEYEGYPEGPLAEAAYAERYLARNPGTRLAPYLHLFLASRYRIAFETQVAKGDKGAERSARLYRQHYRRADRSGDPLISSAVRDLDALSCVYMKLPGTPHPRRFVPTHKTQPAAGL